MIGLVMLMRWLQGRAVFTERVWLLLFGHPREKVFTLWLWLWFAALLLAVVAIGFALGLYLLPYGLGWFVSALILAGVGVLLVAQGQIRRLALSLPKAAHVIRGLSR
jgi:hypothetical protein